MPRPLIGVSVGVEHVRHGSWEEPAAVVSLAYLEMLQAAGASGLILAPDDGLAAAPGDVLSLLDGLLLTGGFDIDPLAYGGPPHREVRHTAPERDRLEIALAHHALARDLPLLGICRGSQVLNVATGGTLIQHLPDVVDGDRHRVSGGGAFVDHDVRLEPGSLAARAVGGERATVRSSHHQGIAELGEGVAASGWSVEDGIVEAIELPAARFALGVLWHAEADARSRVLAALVEAAAEAPVGAGAGRGVPLPQHGGHRMQDAGG